MSDPDKALTLAAQINDLHQQILKSDKGTLDFAIRAGELLNLAKETVGLRKWSAWRTEHCPDIPQTTASLWMRLAVHKPIFSKQRVASMEAGGDLSLRAAAKLIPKDPERAAQAKERAAKKAQKEAEEAAARRSKDAIKDLLSWAAPDELFLVMMLTWEEEQLKVLADRLADHLGRRAASPASITNAAAA